MKTLFTAEAISQGGRSGTLHSADCLLGVTLGNPLEPDSKRRGPSPELLFAGAYSACFHGALGNAAWKLGIHAHDHTARAVVSLMEEIDGAYRLAVALYAHFPGVNHDTVQRLMDLAHQTCPYSKALRGDVAVTLSVDDCADQKASS